MPVNKNESSVIFIISVASLIVNKILFSYEDSLSEYAKIAFRSIKAFHED